MCIMSIHLGTQLAYFLVYKCFNASKYTEKSKYTWPILVLIFLIDTVYI